MKVKALSIMLILCIVLMPSVFAAPKELEGITKDGAIAKFFTGRELDPIEGIWVTDDGNYTIAITRNKFDEFTQFQYVGVLISDTRGHWQPGSIKIAMNGSSAGRVFMGIWRGSGPWGSRPESRALFHLYDSSTIFFNVPGFAQSRGALLRLDLTGDKGTPKGKGGGTGTGFFISNDLVATNAHVIEGAEKIKVILGDKTANASIVSKDANNDAAILRVEGMEQVAVPLPLGDPRKVVVGDPVYTVGFPLPDLMGTAPKVGEGIINSLTGLSDDLRLFQISIPIQPGNSGGPLINKSGQVIGIVSLKLSEIYALKHKGVIPQNVNYAFKISYLINAAPVRLSYSNNQESLTIQEVVERASKAVVFVVAEN